MPYYGCREDHDWRDIVQGFDIGAAIGVEGRAGFSFSASSGCLESTVDVRVKTVTLDDSIQDSLFISIEHYDNFVTVNAN